MSIFGNQYDLGFKDGVEEGKRQMLDEIIKRRKEFEPATSYPPKPERPPLQFTAP